MVTFTAMLFETAAAVSTLAPIAVWAKIAAAIEATGSFVAIIDRPLIVGLRQHGL
jgi:hypothetical protein